MNTLSPEQIREALQGKTEAEIRALAELAGVGRRTIYRIKSGAYVGVINTTLEKLTAALLGIKKQKGMQ